MISLVQVKELELRVGKIVNALRVQNAENANLRQRVIELESRLKELEHEISNQRADEDEIEAGLQGVFDILNRIDAPDEVSEKSKAQSGSDAGPGVYEANPETESFPEHNGNDAQTDGNDPYPSKSNSKHIPHTDNFEPEGEDDTNVDDERFQGEFDIF